MLYEVITSFGSEDDWVFSSSVSDDFGTFCDDHIVGTFVTEDDGTRLDSQNRVVFNFDQTLKLILFAGRECFVGSDVTCKDS